MAAFLVAHTADFYCESIPAIPFNYSRYFISGAFNYARLLFGQVFLRSSNHSKISSSNFKHYVHVHYQSPRKEERQNGLQSPAVLKWAEGAKSLRV